MIIPCEMLIKILGKAIPTVENNYGCMANVCSNSPCVAEFNAVVDKILKLKAVNKQWKTVFDKFLINRHLYQMLFFHELIKSYNPYPRFVLYKTGSEPFHLGLHPFEAEGDSEHHEWVLFLKSIIFAPENACFEDIFICPANISRWLPQLIEELKTQKTQKTHVKRLRIGSCGAHELPFLDSGSNQYRLLIQLHDTIKQVSAKPEDFLLKNPIYCNECRKLDFCEWNQSAPALVFCARCDEPVDLQVICCACINMCNCWKTHYDYDLLPFMRDCGSIICKYCADDGREYQSDSCPNRND